MECKNKGDTSNNRGDWDYFKDIYYCYYYYYYYLLTYLFKLHMRVISKSRAIKQHKSRHAHKQPLTLALEVYKPDKIQTFLLGSVHFVQSQVH